MRYTYDGQDWQVEYRDLLDIWLVNPENPDDIIHVNELPEENAWEVEDMVSQEMEIENEDDESFKHGDFDMYGDTH